MTYHCQDVTTPPDEDGFEAGGSTADVGLYLGQPTHLHLMRMHANHKHNLLMIAPNGNGVPEGVVRLAKDLKVEPIAPSMWASCIIQDSFESNDEIDICYHGAYVVEPQARQIASRIASRAARVSNRKLGSMEPMSLLHVTSTASDRKGTISLLQAMRLPNLLKKPHQLTIQCDETIHQDIVSLVESVEVQDRVKVVSEKIPNDGSWHIFIESFDAVIQPSRAEGFGLVPLEAAYVGVPVIMTTRTGHASFCDSIVHEPVFQRDISESIPGEEFEVLPIEPEHIALAIQGAYGKLVRMSSNAVAAREQVRYHWSWKSVVETWLKRRFK